MALHLREWVRHEDQRQLKDHTEEGDEEEVVGGYADE